MNNYPQKSKTIAQSGRVASLVVLLCLLSTTVALSTSGGNGNSSNGGGKRPSEPVILGRLDSLSAELNIILAYQDFNGDGQQDTLKAEYVQANARTAPYKARLIAWGRQRDSLGLPRGTARFTEIIYPGNYMGLRTPVSIKRYNQDSLSDIIFTLRGKVKHGQDTIDAFTSIAVFGQPQLYEQPFILLGDIKNHQKKPFQALVLQQNNHLRHKEKRDLSGTYSWELPRIKLNTQDTSAVEEKNGGGNNLASTIKLDIYPNPAVYTTNLKAAMVPAGLYGVRIISSNGAEAFVAEVDLKAEGDITRSIDVSQLATGFYMILVSHNGQFIGSFPVVISH